MKALPWASLLLLSLASCDNGEEPPPPPENNVSFALDEDLNGQNLANLDTAAFGFAEIDNEADGIIDSSVIILAASDRDTICADLAADPNNPPEGTTVISFVTKLGPLLGGEETLVNDPKALDTIVFGGFFAVAGGVNLAAATAPVNGVAGDSFTINELVAGESLRGQLSISLTEDITDEQNPLAINIAMTGTFEAVSCAALDEIAGQVQ